MHELNWKKGVFRILPTHSVRLTPQRADGDFSRLTRMTNEEKRERFRELLKTARPDLVLLNGDMLFAPATEEEAADLLDEPLAIHCG